MESSICSGAGTRRWSRLAPLRLELADPESSRWSAASCDTGPSWGHLFSPDPEPCRRGDPLREHKESQSISSPPCHLGQGSASRRLELAPAVWDWWGCHRSPSFTSLVCLCAVLSPLPPLPAVAARLWTWEQVRQGQRGACAWLTNRTPGGAARQGGADWQPAPLSGGTLLLQGPCRRNRLRERF